MSAQESDTESSGAARAEASFAADYVQRLIAGGFTVQDDKTHEPRAVREEDIILMRSPRTRLADYRRAGEPRAALCRRERRRLYETMEVAVTFALLEILDNPRQDVPLIFCVLRSPLFRLSRRTGSPSCARKRRAAIFTMHSPRTGRGLRHGSSRCCELRESARTLTLTELVAALYERCHIPAVFGAMRGGAARRENLRAFFRWRRNLSAAAGGALRLCPASARAAGTGEPPVPQTTHAAQGVRIMSIHKSKGLEFPIVILADLARPFSRMDFQSPCSSTRNTASGRSAWTRKRSIKYPTAARLALERQLRREAKAEELRVLYVAMTRAKEKLVMVCARAGAAKHLADLCAVTSCPVRPETVEEQKCMADWILLPLLCRPEAAPLRELAGADAAAVTVSDAPWRVEVHNGYDFRAHRARGRGARGGRLPPSCRWTRRRWSGAIPTNRKRRSAPADRDAAQRVARLTRRSRRTPAASPPAEPPQSRDFWRERRRLRRRAGHRDARGAAVSRLLDAGGRKVRCAPQSKSMEERRLLTPEQARAVDAAAAASRSYLVIKRKSLQKCKKVLAFSCLM